MNRYGDASDPAKLRAYIRSLVSGDISMSHAKGRVESWDRIDAIEQKTRHFKGCPLREEI